ncbi:hypothetical protein C7S16_2367 [Burkholderia thailandensis]|uniref:Uncharacterized protein n=1 Tax=Burkholderia thailandensis TaxID=57975 RepID=A0AAW9D227_BURTH|nr:hypothetical protein [Burkholderia thailandensis]MDW9255302.1 hypothetical protein [Burkholderia thailandensis]
MTRESAAREPESIDGARPRSSRGVIRSAPHAARRAGRA